jgi:nucleoside-diphosphate-sugar epimerase
MSIVIGNGMIGNEAKSIWSKYSNHLIYASGVSNSACEDANEFLKEKNMLQETINKIKSDYYIIYYSTCSIYDSSISKSSKYIQHKLEMESLVRKCKKFYIFRLPQVVGHTNSDKTLIKYFYNSIQDGRKIQVYKNAFRNLIDVNDVIKLSEYICGKKEHENKITNIANPKNISIKSIINIIAEIVNKKPNIEIIDDGSSYEISNQTVNEICEKAGVSFDRDYEHKVIKKYYSSRNEN